jgi:hypothetical protein
MRVSSIWLAGSLLVALLSGCATQPAEPESLDQMLKARNYVFGERVDRIRNSRISGWNALDDRNVIITAGVSDRYLVTLRNRCYGLDSAHQLSFTISPGGLSRFDKLTVIGFGAIEDTCFIEAIYKVEAMELDNTSS